MLSAPVRRVPPRSLASLPALPAAWRELVAFTARYYQRSLGEVALAVLPPELRKLGDEDLHKKLRKLDQQLTKPAPAPPEAAAPPPLSVQQQAALAVLYGALNAVADGAPPGAAPPD